MPTTPDDARPGRALGWLIAAFVPALVLRAAILLERGVGAAGPNLRGLASDAGAAAAVGLLALLLARIHRWLGAVGIAVWTLVLIANFQHVRVNAANAAWQYAGFLADPTFLLGSATALEAPVAVVASALAAAVAAVWALGAGRAGVGPTLAVAVGASALLLLWPVRIDVADWRQANPLESNLRSTGSAAAPQPAERARALVRREAADLSGEPRLALPTKARNVLLVMLEAIPGAALTAVAEANDLPAPDVSLEHLDALAAEHMVYTSFVAQQRQTNRGEYALLCGDWPSLETGLPRMSAYVSSGGPDCLPEILRDRGFATVYLQAAPLAFMMKDQFMVRAGFETVRGNASFADAYRRTNWGVDDRTLFEAALDEVERLDSEERPWFLTLLTVGTHHPFNVPAAFEPEGEGFARAARYADGALGAFLDALEAGGHLDDTLVLITSDESIGLDATRLDDPLAVLSSRNHSFLIALLPEADRDVVAEPFLQSDLALSILDALGVAEEIAVGEAGAPSNAMPGGRSVFRSHTEPRRLAFANTYQGRLFVVEPDGTIGVCREDVSACTGYRGRAGRPFATGATRSGPVGEAARADWAAFVQPAVPVDGQPAVEIALLAGPAVEVIDGEARFQLVYGGQGLFAPAGASVELDVDVTLDGPGGHASLRMNLVSGNGAPLYQKELVLRAGERAQLRVHIRAEAALEGLESRFVVHDRSGPGLGLDFAKATLRIVPGRPSADSPRDTTRRAIVEDERIDVGPASG